MRQKILLALLLASATVAYAESIALKQDGGTFVVPVLVNNKITLNFTLDSGASDVSIPADVFSTLTRTGTVAPNDLLGEQTYELADGSKQTSQRFRIQSLRVGSLELRNVIASVAPPEGSLLLGLSFLSRLKSWSIDNERHLLLFNEPPAGGTVTSTVARHAPSAARLPPTAAPHAAMANVDDEVLLKAVAYVLTGDDVGPVGVVDRPNCVFEFDHNFGGPSLHEIAHLNNVDRTRSKIQRITTGDRSQPGVKITLRGEQVIEFPPIPPSDLGDGFVVTGSPAKFASEETIVLRTDESQRVLRAWDYIYSHGCKGRASAF